MKPVKINNPAKNNIAPISANPMNQEAPTAEAENLKDEFIGIECILIAMTKCDGLFIKELLKKYRVDTNSVLNAMKKIRGNKKVDNKNAEENMKALEKYSTDLTEMAKKGKLDPVIGRDEEVRRIIQVLNRRTKNNPVLIGEPDFVFIAIVLLYVASCILNERGRNLL